MEGRDSLSTRIGLPRIGRASTSPSASDGTPALMEHFQAPNAFGTICAIMAAQDAGTEDASQ
ncbi:MAG: hypothetical protein SGI98_00215 [Verrucomicrobiota bacterium]|nr:hypothetical protein [Verrucomicrobiota bacterium]